jgi:hypothetical protein
VRRRTVELAAGELRAEVAARIRERCRDYWRRAGHEGTPRAARIEAGEAVHVASWELPREHLAYGGIHWYTLEHDGSLTALE